jgi:hypothetical protein
MAQPGLAYLGLAWPGSQPEAGPGTALYVCYPCKSSVSLLCLSPPNDLSISASLIDSVSEGKRNGTGLHVLPNFPPPAPRHQYTLGHSELVNLLVPTTSTSMSTLREWQLRSKAHHADIFRPSVSPGWPHFTASSSIASLLGMPNVNTVDPSILNVLMRAT